MRRTTSFTIDQQDMTRLEELSDKLRINKSRVISLAIGCLHTIADRSFPEKEKTYADIVIPQAGEIL